MKLYFNVKPLISELHQQQNKEVAAIRENPITGTAASQVYMGVHGNYTKTGNDCRRTLAATGIVLRDERRSATFNVFGR